MLLALTTLELGRPTANTARVLEITQTTRVATKRRPRLLTPTARRAAPI